MQPDRQPARSSAAGWPPPPSSPHLVLTDGFYTLLDNVPPVGLAEEPTASAQRSIGQWNPYREMFGLLWQGKRHVMMGATQVDRYGNQNIAAIGDWHQPRSQLLGFRGAPGNTINHTTSYWVPNHSTEGVRRRPSTSCAASATTAPRELGPRGVAVPRDPPGRVQPGRVRLRGRDGAGVPTMRLRSVHPGVTVDEVVEATGFDLVVPDDVPESRLPTDDELPPIRERLDPRGCATPRCPSRERPADEPARRR